MSYAGEGLEPVVAGCSFEDSFDPDLQVRGHKGMRGQVQWVGLYKETLCRAWVVLACLSGTSGGRLQL